MDEIELAAFIDRVTDTISQHYAWCVKPPVHLGIGMDHTIATDRDAVIAREALRRRFPDIRIAVSADAPEGCIDLMVCPLHGMSGWCSEVGSAHPGEESLPPGSEG